ncbi:hypothetical protein BD408DRAFT_432320 [Parasitella parasitica]|nr:hypothetical protein BD408DRAFT_432320 [Parasitella parasitica]
MQISLAEQTGIQNASRDKAVLSSIWSAIRGKLNPTASANATMFETPVQEALPSAKTMQEEPNNTVQDKVPSQMAPIQKAIVYLRPKADERWVLREEGSIIWAISNTLQSKADTIYMNCNLYQGEKMLLSVFKGVPLIVGTESWTPPVFLEPAPDYRLRLWSQPSEAGIIDEYSTEFSMVPRPDDAYMFSYNRSAMMDNSNATLPPDTRIRIGQYNLPPVNESQHSGIMLGVSNNPTASFSDPNLPTGIYALYPSVSGHVSVECYLYAIVLVTGLVAAFM